MKLKDNSFCGGMPTAGAPPGAWEGGTSSTAERLSRNMAHFGAFVLGQRNLGSRYNSSITARFSRGFFASAAKPLIGYKFERSSRGTESENRLEQV